MATRPNLDHLPQVQELNRVFLEFVQTRAKGQLDCLGLPAGARLILRNASEPSLDAVALFPRALFRLRLDGAELRNLAEGVPFDAAHHDLCLSILWSARQTTRQSAYQARLLFGLEERELRLLQALPLAELQRLACHPDMLLCAFTDREWLWRKLLTDVRPEARRELALVALQPGIERDWPERRPAHPVT